MATYQMIRPNPLFITMKFQTYKAAIDFSTKSGVMKPSKPYKRMMHLNGELKTVWCVTLPQAKPETAMFLKAA